MKSIRCYDRLVLTVRTCWVRPSSSVTLTTWHKQLHSSALPYSGQQNEAADENKEFISDLRRTLTLESFILTFLLFFQIFEPSVFPGHSQRDEWLRRTEGADRWEHDDEHLHRAHQIPAGAQTGAQGGEQEREIVKANVNVRECVREHKMVGERVWDSERGRDGWRANVREWKRKKW